MGKGKRLRTQRKETENATVVSWSEPMEFDMLDRWDFRDQHKEELPSMEGYGWRSTSLLTGEVTDYTFETQEEFEKACLEFFNPENQIRMLEEAIKNA